MWINTVRAIGLALSLALLSSCSTFSPLSWFKPGGGLEVETEIVAGDKEQEANIGTDTVNAGKIGAIVNGMRPYQLIMFALLAGWAIPTPLVMLKGILLAFQMIWRAIRGRPL